MDNNEIKSAIEPLVKVLNDLGISYYVCGSIASSAYGLSRTTQDIDIVSDISKDLVEVFAERLRDEYFIDADMIVEAIDAKTSFNLIHLETMMKIDIFILRDDSFHEKTIERKIEDKLDEDENSIKVFFSSAEDVILSKLLWFVSGNQVSEKQWSDILGIIKVQKENLDRFYLKHWALKLSVDHLLQKAFLECDLKI